MTNPWEPDYWFLAKSDDMKDVYEAGSPQRNARAFKAMSLNGRFHWWKKALEGEWNATNAAEYLLAPYTSNNLVTPFIDGESYMGDLYANLNDADVDFVLLAGWQFTSTQLLRKDDQNSMVPRLLRRIITNNGRVGLLAWDNLTSGTDKGVLVKMLNDIDTLNPSIAYLDQNLDGGFLSHHQKTVVVGKKANGQPDWSESRAYVGGIDLAVDRWDNTIHWKAKTEEGGHFIAWHDIQVSVRGDALMQIWANFAERWSANKAWLAKSGQTERLATCPLPVPIRTRPGTHYVQVLRTITAVRSGFPDRFMPSGERTILYALVKAISKAECYIYIEEQFLWDGELADCIARRMKKKPELRLIVVLAASTELPGQYGQWHYHRRSLFFMKVTGAETEEEISFGAKTRVYPYGLHRPDGQGSIYVHSKLFIIDDRYVALGSANVCERSMYVDTELTLGIVDANVVDSSLGGKAAKVGRFARDLRETLWMEHLGIGPFHPNFRGKDAFNSNEQDPLKALSRFPGAAENERWPTSSYEARRRARHHVRCYVNVPGRKHFFGWNLVTEAEARIMDRNERHW
jgi:phosphatidylserine/phosphatidylglycerophosphate/cardiolipin synthase-like enzyme